MDIGAYVQIDDLKKIAEDNGIYVPRLRGYRLMKNEQPVSQESIDELKRMCEVDCVRALCSTRPVWNPNAEVWFGDDETDILEDYYLVSKVNEDGDKEYVDIRWDRIHGKKRRILKFEIKKQKRHIQQQYDTFNKYVGRDDVLYIHSRMGGGNWKYFEGKREILSQPWFLDRIDDHYDGTYCDFYAKIEPVQEVNDD